MASLVNGTSHSNSQPNSKVFPLQTYANAISSAADVITDYCTSNHLPHPSFRPDAPKITIPLTAPLAIHSARQTLIDSATKIQQVITEPADYLPRLAVHVGSIGFFFLSRFFFSAVVFILNHSLQQHQQQYRSGFVSFTPLANVLHHSIRCSLVSDGYHTSASSFSSLPTTPLHSLNWRKAQTSPSISSGASFAWR